MTDRIKPLMKENLINELGVSGTTIINGFIEEDYRSDLQGREGCLTYEQMRKSDAQVFAILLACELPIRSTKWFIEAGVNSSGKIDNKSQEVADFIKYNLFEALENTFDDLLREILTMLPFGYSVFEKVYGLDQNSQVILKKLGYRKQSTIYKWQTDDRQPGLVQLVPGNTDDATESSKKNANISIPMQKLLLFSFRKEGKNYEWASILRSAYKHWYIKDKLYKFDAIRHERQSVGIPIIYLPKNSTPEDKLEAQRIVRNIRSTEQTGIVMPGPKDEGWLFEFADSRANSGTDLFESIKHHNREISKNVLAQFLELGDTQSGSRALGESQWDLFLLSLEAIAKQIADTINKHLIQEMVDLNYDIWEYSYPQLKFEKLWSVDYAVLTTNLVALTGAGLLEKDDNLEDYIRESFGLPAKQNDGSENDTKDSEISTTSDNQDQIKSLEDQLLKLQSDLQNKDQTDKNKLQNQIKKWFSELQENILEKHSCNHWEEDQIFNKEYFNELSSIIDRKFIIDTNAYENK